MSESLNTFRQLKYRSQGWNGASSPVLSSLRCKHLACSWQIKVRYFSPLLLRRFPSSDCMTRADFPSELTVGCLSYLERWQNKDHNNMCVCVCVKEINTHLKSGQQETNMSLGNEDAQINKPKLIIVDISTTSTMQILNLPLDPWPLAFSSCTSLH